MGKPENGQTDRQPSRHTDMKLLTRMDAHAHTHSLAHNTFPVQYLVCLNTHTHTFLIHCQGAWSRKHTQTHAHTHTYAPNIRTTHKHPHIHTHTHTHAHTHASARTHMYNTVPKLNICLSVLSVRVIHPLARWRGSARWSARSAGTRSKQWR